MSVFMYPIYQSQCFTDKICCLKKYLIGQERRSILFILINKKYILIRNFYVYIKIERNKVCKNVY